MQEKKFYPPGTMDQGTSRPQKGVPSSGITHPTGSGSFLPSSTQPPAPRSPSGSLEKPLLILSYPLTPASFKNIMNRERHQQIKTSKKRKIITHHPNNLSLFPSFPFQALFSHTYFFK